ncbi:hypothetical protein PLESTB_001369200 [Pleodorina starrii]|uniref:Uncharacterized protein n=1 Tax=Pleodorina starrii TaxID=330485 RepID=A0A9W6F6V5_9CHLO|nr:hypothetical protein PLESTM_000415800 [Pleodorina starrii]GLC58514.1 hypothetical protein PLESTB_001369200 [Pleodorina starrii]
MKFPLTIKAFGPELTATKAFAATADALSNLDPAPYSLPEPPASVSGGGKGSSLQSTTAAEAAAAAVAMTSLPGCAIRPSMDISTPDSKPRRTVAGRSSLYAYQPTDLAACRDVDAVQDAQPSAAPLRQQQHLKAQPPPTPPPPAAARRASLHYDRDANRARRNYRPSIDAAAGALMLYTRPAAEPQSPSATVSDSGPRLAAVYDMPGCVPPPLQAPLAQVLPPPPPPGAVAAAAANEWCFGDNLQRARMLARYAAMVAAEDMRYEPSPGGAAGNDSDDDGGGGGEGSRRSRGAWKLLSSFLSSTKGSKAASASASIVQRWQEATAPAGGRRCDGAGGGGGSRRSMANDDTPVVVRSRDSRRLLRVHRSRVGIEIDGERQKQKAPGRASAPAFTQQLQQQQQPKLSVRQLQSRNSAPALLHWEGEEDDAVTAAVIAAAAELAAVDRSP